jgi:mannose-6-phosphate isomerase-like protein (cupin superfamily)
MQQQQNLTLQAALATLIHDAMVTHQPKIINIKEATAQGAHDSAVNITIMPLAGDDTFRLYATALGPGEKVKAHLHSEGLEIYDITQGEGEVYTGSYDAETGQVAWNEPLSVKAGDTFAIEPGMVHQLRNTSRDTILRLTFGCPASHLAHDRIVVPDYPA